MSKKLEISIKNFKSIRELNLSIHVKSKSRVLKIIGNNNAGKTNILEGINRLSSSQMFSQSDKTKYFDGSYEESNLPEIHFKMLFHDWQTNEEIPIESTLKNNFGVSYSSFEPSWLEQKRKNIQTMIEKIQENPMFKTSGAFLTSNNETFKNNNWYNSFLSMIELTKDNELINLVKRVKSEFSYLKIQQKPNIRFIKTLNLFKYTNLDLNLLFQEDLPAQIELEQREIIRAWEKILSIDFEEVLREVSKKDAIDRRAVVNSFEKKANQLISGITKLYSLDELKNKFTIEIDYSEARLFINLNAQEPNNPEQFIWDKDPMNSGDGIKAFWSLVFRIQAIHKDEPIIILLDEPEKHLNPIYQKALSSYFHNMFSSASRINQILILVTHSPFMIGEDWYQSTHIAERDDTFNSTTIKSIYSNQNGTPNLLIDKNDQLRYIESQFMPCKPNQIIFVEGISDYNVIKKFLNDNTTFVIPLFGANYKITASFHLPYINYITDKIKLIIDNDAMGHEIAKWFKVETNILAENIKYYSDFSEGLNTLEEFILQPWIQKRNDLSDSWTNDKKINSIIFRENFAQEIEVKNFVDFLKK